MIVQIWIQKIYILKLILYSVLFRWYRSCMGFSKCSYLWCIIIFYFSVKNTKGSITPQRYLCFWYNLIRKYEIWIIVLFAGILEDRDEKNKGGALFFREYGRTASYYANRTFEPVYESIPELIIPANRSADIQKANALCGDSYQCKYDYAVSLNRDLAFYTLQYQDGFVNTKKMSKQRGTDRMIWFKYNFYRIK